MPRICSRATGSQTTYSPTLDHIVIWNVCIICSVDRRRHKVPGWSAPNARARLNISPLASLRDWDWSRFPRGEQHTIHHVTMSRPKAWGPPAPRSPIPTPRMPVVRTAPNRCRSCCTSRGSRSRNAMSSCVDVTSPVVHTPRLPPLLAIPGQCGSSLRRATTSRRPQACRTSHHLLSRFRPCLCWRGRFSLDQGGRERPRTSLLPRGCAAQDLPHFGLDALPALQYA